MNFFKRKFFVILIYAFWAICSSSIHGAIPATERAALISFYNATNGDHWTNTTGWKTPPLDSDGFAMPGTENQWRGVIVSGDHVSEILQYDQNLTGIIPPDIKNLTKLHCISMSKNKLTSIPSEIGTLSELKYIILESNLLTSLPSEIGNVSSLEQLILSNNSLTSIPSEIGNLNGLTYLYLGQNKLTSLPTQIGNLSNLRFLYVDHNLLTSIPSSIGNLTTLWWIGLSNNQLSSLPTEIENLTLLISLRIDHNAFTSIPSCILKLKIPNLDMSYNHITGSIPVSLLYQTNIHSLNLSHNNLSGGIPAPGSTFAMEYSLLDLSYNQLSGEIPNSLFLHLNFLLPDPDVKVKQKVTAADEEEPYPGIKLSNNRLSGSINPNFGYFDYCRWLELDLSNNEFTGRIPVELKNYAIVNVSNNRLSGVIPEDIFKSHLYHFNLRSNSFSGEIPDSVIVDSNYLESISLDIGYNAFYSNQSGVVEFLKKEDADWFQTQTVVPTNISALGKSSSSIRVSWTPVTYTANSGEYRIYKSDSASGPWTVVGNTSGKSVSFYDVTGLNPGQTYYFSVRTFTNAHANNKNDVISDFSAAVSASTIDNVPPVISINRSNMAFSFVEGGALPGAQTVSIKNVGGGTLNWSVSSEASWISLSPSSGTGNGTVSVSILPTGLAVGNYSGVILVSDPNATNSGQSVSVSLNVKSKSEDLPPFGEFATPSGNSTVSGSIPVTGWALDDTGVESVKIYCEDGESLRYLGDGVFIEGLRPDVEAAYSTYPMNYRAGWGYMLLTNFLPNGGNGVYKLHAIARDLNGNKVDLGVKSIKVDNAHAVKPFGAIDTPAQGGNAEGSSYVNWGWVLTPQPNYIPADGSTIGVWIDGVHMGSPVYNNFRSDIASLFPNLANSNGAVGYFYLDTTKLSTGAHTIEWRVTDSGGNSDGIGSRYFWVTNSGLDRQNDANGSNASFVSNEMARVNGASIQSISTDRMTGEFKPKPVNEMLVNKGFDDEEAVEMVSADDGTFGVEIRELERLVIRFPGTVENDSSLPVGASLDKNAGVFYWMPGPGFIGTYHLAFLEKDENGVMVRKQIRVNIIPRD